MSHQLFHSLRPFSSTVARSADNVWATQQRKKTRSTRSPTPASLWTWEGHGGNQLHVRRSTSQESMCRKYTVNVEVFAQYIFLRISCRALYARKFDVSEDYYHNRTNRINSYVREN